MTKNNLKIVKTDDKKEKELKEKNKSLDAAISQIDQNFGKGSVMRLGQQQALDIEAISTGSLSLDLALGIGGLPKGRIIEIYGPESSGKTTLALQVVAEAQVQRFQVRQFAKRVWQLFTIVPSKVQHIIRVRAIGNHLNRLGQRGEPSLFPGFGSIRSIVYTFDLQAREEVRQVRQRFGKVFAVHQGQRLELGQLCNGLRKLFEFRAVTQNQHFEVD